MCVYLEESKELKSLRERLEKEDVKEQNLKVVAEERCKAQTEFRVKWERMKAVQDRANLTMAAMIQKDALAENNYHQQIAVTRNLRNVISQKEALFEM